MFNKCQLHFQKTHLSLNYPSNCLSTKLQFGLGNLVTSELYFNLWFPLFLWHQGANSSELVIYPAWQVHRVLWGRKNANICYKNPWIKDYLQVKIFCYLLVTPPTILVIVALIWTWLRILNLKKTPQNSSLEAWWGAHNVHQTTVLKCCWLPPILLKPPFLVICSAG